MKSPSYRHNLNKTFFPLTPRSFVPVHQPRDRPLGSVSIVNLSRKSIVPEFLSIFTLWFGLLMNIFRNTENFKCGDSELKGYEISFQS